MHSQGEVYKVSMVPARRYSAPTQQLRGYQVQARLKQGQNVNKTPRTDYRENRQTSKQANRKADKHI